MIPLLLQLIGGTLIVFGTSPSGTSVPAGKHVTPVTCSELCVRVLCETWDVEFNRAQAIRQLSQRPDGSVSIDRLVACLNSFGFECDVRQGTPELLHETQAPLIIHLQQPAAPGSAGHYVVVTNTQEGLVAYDPTASAAPGLVDPKRLSLMWTGIAIFVRPVGPEEHILFWCSLLAGLLGATLILLHLGQQRRERAEARTEH